jgi:hypothetical protein
MAQSGTLHDRKFADQAHDLRGAELYGSNDEKLDRIKRRYSRPSRWTHQVRRGRYRRLAAAP